MFKRKNWYSRNLSHDIPLTLDKMKSSKILEFLKNHHKNNVVKGVYLKPGSRCFFSSKGIIHYFPNFGIGHKSMSSDERKDVSDVSKTIDISSKAKRKYIYIGDIKLSEDM